MVHDSTWLTRTRAARRMLAVPVGLLLACVLFAGLPAVASASTPEMRGEWELVIKAPGQPTGKAIAVITVEANSKEEFAASSMLFEHVIHGTFSGTLKGSEASIEVTTEAYGPLMAGKFTSTTMTVQAGGSLPSISGSGELLDGTTPVPGASVVATRIKSQKEIEEREAREAKEKAEREEQEARESVRGEWSLVVKAGPQASSGTALIRVSANTKNEFASSSGFVEGIVPGSFSGTLEGATVSVTVASEAYGPLPATEFTGEKLAIESKDGSLSISGTGKLYSNKVLLTEDATLLATRTKTFAEVTAREAKEKAEREATEKAELEAKAKAEQEATEKAEQEAKAKAELEAKAKAEQEAKAKAELEAKKKQELEAQEKANAGKTPSNNVDTAALVSVQLSGKTFTVSAAGSLSLQVSNPNAYAISGRITLSESQSGQSGKGTGTHGKASKKALPLGTVSFGITASGKQSVKLELSQAGRTELAHHKTLRVLASILTKANGQTSTTKTFTLTLHAGKGASGKH
ncbi:MAG: hypothetical protein WBQ21_12820 [Solirubrobacteraceae bacterium]